MVTKTHSAHSADMCPLIKFGQWSVGPKNKYYKHNYMKKESCLRGKMNNGVCKWKMITKTNSAHSADMYPFIKGGQWSNLDTEKVQE